MSKVRLWESNRINSHTGPQRCQVKPYGSCLPPARPSHLLENPIGPHCSKFKCARGGPPVCSPCLAGSQEAPDREPIGLWISRPLSTCPSQDSYSSCWNPSPILVRTHPQGHPPSLAVFSTRLDSGLSSVSLVMCDPGQTTSLSGLLFSHLSLKGEVRSTHSKCTELGRWDPRSPPLLLALCWP